jgi:hypothetical protein
MKKQRETDAKLRIRVKTHNQRLGNRSRAEQCVGEIDLGRHANRAETLVLGQAADECLEIADVVARRRRDAERTLVRGRHGACCAITTPGQE